MKKEFILLSAFILFTLILVSQNNNQKSLVSNILPEKPVTDRQAFKERMQNNAFLQERIVSKQEKGTKEMKKLTEDNGKFRKATQEQIQRIKKTPATITYTGRFKSSNAADKATIVLHAEDVWEDGTGYQMLLDADHNTYGSVIPEEGALCDEDTDGSVYANFEYKIPANADGILTTSNVIIDDEGSVDVPEGYYDFCITNPTPGDRVWIASGTYGRQNDYYFEAGYTYTFEVVFGGYNDMVLHTPAIDGAITKIILPDNSSSLTASETIEIEISNQGLKEISNFSVSYQVNEKQAVTETYTGTVQPKGKVNYTFSAKADFSQPGSYLVKAWITVEKDANPDNDMVSGRCKHIQPVSLPFFDDFSLEENLYANWTIVDANNDGNTWKYNNSDADADGGRGHARYGYHAENAADDYLFTDPVIMKAGNHHFTYYYYTAMDESWEILYGTTMNPSEMTRLLNMEEVSSNSWKISITNFNVATGGEYYFAFHATSAPDMYFIGIDNVSIGEGDFIGTPDIAVTSIDLPTSGCELSSDATIGATIYNNGTADIENFTVSYQINGNTPVTQTFNQRIAMDESIKVEFDTKADFSQTGTYEVIVTAKCEGQKNEDNDSMMGRVVNFDPIGLPFNSLFINNADAANWNPETSSGWEWDEEEGLYYANEENVGLVSRCITLSEGVYNFGFTYVAGFDILGIFYLPDDFHIACGKTGTDISTWEVIKEYTEEYTDYYFVTDDFIFEIKEDGEYSFAFVSTDLSLLVLESVNIQDVKDHDIRLNTLTNGLPPMVPAYHMNAQVEFKAEVSNRGKNAATGAKLEVKKDGSVIATSSPVTLDLDGKETLTASALLNNIKPHQLVKFTGEVSMDNPDEYIADNQKEIEVFASDSVFAWDNALDFYGGVGSSQGTISFGCIFELTKEDELTSITLGLGETEIDEEIGLAVYNVNNDFSIGEPILSKTYQRGLGGEAKNFVMPVTRLDAGKYYFEIQQLSANNVTIAYDGNPKGYFMIPEGGYLEEVTGFGYIHLRPNFGNNPLVGVISKNVSPDNIYLYYNKNTKILSVHASGNQIEEIVIYNLLGQIIYTMSPMPDSTEYIINTQRFTQGVYIANIRTGNKAKAFKFIVE